MQYFPVFMDLREQTVLIVGGGSVAARKARLLLKAGARISVIARDIGSDISRWVSDGRIDWVAQEYSPDQLDGARLVFAATSNRDLNATVYRDAEELRIPVNIVDDLSLCRFISPAVIDRSPIQIAISSSGTSPVIVRRIRAWIEALLPQGLGKVAELAGRLRYEFKSKLPMQRRRRFWEQTLTDANLSYWSNQSPDKTSRALRKELRGFLSSESGDSTTVGKVYLVGAGPGHPDLLTIRAQALLRAADVVLHDRLVSAEILDRVRRDADLIDVGKRAGNHHKTQAQIEELMVEQARMGRTVVRLKGGDAFIFGRGGEELQHLSRHGIDYEVVPGVTAAAGCAAYSGIPLTHRDHAQVLTLVTGHMAAQDESAVNDDEDEAAAMVDWAGIAGPGRTVVVYMGVRQAGSISRSLLKAGVSATLPATLVTNGTLDNQQVISGKVGSLPEMAAESDSGSPGLFIIGDVAALGDTLSWFTSPFNYEQHTGSPNRSSLQAAA